MTRLDTETENIISYYYAYIKKCFKVNDLNCIRMLTALNDGGKDELKKKKKKSWYPLGKTSGSEKLVQKYLWLNEGIEKQVNNLCTK